MKILFISNNFPPIIDGVGDYTFHLAAELAKLGHDIYIICSNKVEIRNKTNYTLGLTVYPIINNWNKNGISTALKTIKAIQPNWVSLQYVPYSFQKKGLPIYLLSLFRQLKKENFKSHIMFHEVAIRYDAKPPLSYIYGSVQRYIAHKLVDLTESSFTSNPFYQKLLKNKPKVKVVRIGSNITSSDRTSSREKPDISSQSDIIISTFSLRFNRGYQGLMEAIIKLKQAKNSFQFKLFILGRLPQNILQKLKDDITSFHLEKQVMITGEIDDLTISKYLSQTDIFILQEEVNNKGEGGCCSKSGVLATAMEHVLPIIGTSGDMTDDSLKKIGIRFTEYDNAEQIFEAIQTLINDKSLCLKLGKKNKIYFNENLNWNTIANEYLSI